MLLLSGCVNEEVLLNPPGGKSFWTLRIRDSYTMKRVTAMYAGEGKYGIAYVADDSSVSDARVSQVLREFDRNIAPKEHALFAKPLDIDGNGKVILLFLDIDDGYTPGGGYIAGYFDPLNQFDDESVQRITGRRSNEAEMLYLDTYPSHVGGSEFMSTLAHEYQHLLQFSFNYRKNSEEEKWVDEGLSEIASDLTGYGPQTSRLIGFRRIGNGLDGALGDSLISWDGTVDDYNHVYMYFRYLVDWFGEEITTKIFQNELSDLDGVESALSQQEGASTSCGGYASNTPFHAHFTCSYRFLWAAILGQTTLQGKTGTATNLTADTVPAQLLPEHNPMNSLRPGDENTIQYYSSPPGSEQTTEPFSFTFFKNNEVNGPPALSNTSCTIDCKPERFSLLYNVERFVVFNHHPGTFFSQTKIIDPRLLPDIEESGEETVVHEEPLFSLSGQSLPAIETRRKLHFYQPLDKATRKLLQAR